MGTQSRRHSIMSEIREFDNPFPDYDGVTNLLDGTGKNIALDIDENLRSILYHMVQRFEQELHHAVDWTDYTVYTGTAGIALCYLHLAHTLRVPQYIPKAMPYIERPMLHLKSKKFSFLCGDPGLLCVAALFYKEQGDEKEVIPLISKLEKMAKLLIPLESGCPDEVLFGRAGYLYALLFVKQKLGPNLISESTIKEVVQSILTSGQHLAKKIRASCPLMYMWHDSYYVGAAHGIIGILYMLLQAREYMSTEDMQKLVKPTIDYVLSLRLPSGNYPSSLGKETDRLVHWCHGAPGAIHLFCLAYEVFKDKKYLEAAYGCSDVIWKRGILRKGYGICHGVSGNAYGFLRLFQTTKNQKYLYRAVKFMEWCFDYGKHGCRIADRPLSLFEGMAGTIYFLADMFKPFEAAFPAFQLSA